MLFFVTAVQPGGLSRGACNVAPADSTPQPAASENSVLQRAVEKLAPF